MGKYMMTIGMSLSDRMKILRALMLLGAPLLIFIAPLWPELSFIHESMEALGHLLVFIGVIIRVYTSLYSEGRKNKVLLMDGPYSVVRNPLYVGSFMAVVGLGLQTGSLILTTAAAFTFLVMHKITIHREESHLRQLYGHAFDQYCLAVPRWMPNFFQWKQPQDLVVQPRMVLLTIRDTSGFILTLILIELLCTLRASGFMPIWFVLP